AGQSVPINSVQGYSGWFRTGTSGRRSPHFTQRRVFVAFNVDKAFATLTRWLPASNGWKLSEKCALSGQSIGRLGELHGKTAPEARGARHRKRDSSATTAKERRAAHPRIPD